MSVRLSIGNLRLECSGTESVPSCNDVTKGSDLSKVKGQILDYENRSSSSSRNQRFTVALCFSLSRIRLRSYPPTCSLSRQDSCQCLMNSERFALGGSARPNENGSLSARSNEPLLRRSPNDLWTRSKKALRSSSSLNISPSPRSRDTSRDSVHPHSQSVTVEPEPVPTTTNYIVQDLTLSPLHH